MSTFFNRLRSRPTPNGGPDESAHRAKAERFQLEKALAKADQKMQAMEKAGQSVGEIQVQLATFEARREQLETQMNSARPIVSLLDSLESRTQAVESTTGEFELRLRDLARQIAETENASDGIEQLLDASREAETRLVKANDHAKTITAVETKLNVLGETLEHFEKQCSSIAKRYGRMEHTSESLSSEIDTMRSWGQRLTEDLGQAKQMASGVEDMLAGMTSASALAKKSSQELHKLNALSEYVAQKLHGLSATKEALERAETQALQVNEVAWQIEDRVKKLKNDQQSILAAEANLERLKTEVSHIDESLSEAQRHKDAFKTESNVALNRIRESSNKLQAQLDQSQVLRDEIGVANERILGLDEELRRHMETVERLSNQQDALQQAGEKVDAALIGMQAIHERIGAVDAQTKMLSETEQRLADLASLSVKIDRQLESIDAKALLVESTKERISDLELLNKEIDLRFSHLQHGKEDVEATLLILSDFRKKTFQTQDQIKEVTEQLSEVEDVRRRLIDLDGIAAQIDRRSQEFEPRLTLVRGLGERLETLNELSEAIDKRTAMQLERKSELESMRSMQEGISLKLEDLSHASASLKGSFDIEAITDRLSEIEGRLEASEKAVKHASELEATLTDSERRMDELVTSVAHVEGQREKQQEYLDSLRAEGERARELQNTWLKDMDLAEQRRLIVEQQAEATETQLRSLEDLGRTLEHRRKQLADTEQKFTDYEAKFTRVDQSFDEMDRRIDAINARHTLVERVKREVDSVFDVFERGREDVTKVLQAHREVKEARAEIELLVEQTDRLGRRFERLEAKIASIDEVENKVDTLNNILSDISMNVEGFHAQKAVIDHVAEKLARVEFTIRQAEMTTVALEEERQLAARVGEAIRTARQGRPEIEDTSQLGLFAGPATVIEEVEPAAGRESRQSPGA